MRYKDHLKRFSYIDLLSYIDLKKRIVKNEYN
jgi:hypothetical protein